MAVAQPNGRANPALEKFPLAGRKISIDPYERAVSPSFRTTYPPVRNLELVPDGIRALMEESWARGQFEVRDIEIFLIHGAYVIGECLILDDNLQVISNASDKYTDAEIGVALDRILKEIAEQSLPHMVGPAVMSTRRAANNYGHFLLEMLPMTMVANRLIADFKPHFLLHRVEPPMLDVALRAFRLLDIPLDHLLIRDALEPMHFEHLVVVRGLTEHGTYMSSLCVDLVATLTRKVLPGDQKKLLVRRRPGWQRGRSLLNEAELCDRLQPLGFRVIEPSELTLEQQISAFSGADQVIAVCGAALTNIAFCRPGTRVVNLASSHFPDTFFWFIALHRKLHYVELRGQSTSGEDFEPAADFRISDADLSWLEGLQQEAGTTAGADITAYVCDVGDVRCGIGEWAGFPGSRRGIEGFSIAGPCPNRQISYRAVLGRNWLSPWYTDGKFCGTRGAELPLYGLGVRLEGDLADAYDCFCDATFLDGTRKEGVPVGECCMTDGLAALEAFRVVLRPKG